MTLASWCSFILCIRVARICPGGTFMSLFGQTCYAQLLSSLSCVSRMCHFMSPLCCVAQMSSVSVLLPEFICSEAPLNNKCSDISVTVHQGASVFWHMHICNWGYLSKQTSFWSSLHYTLKCGEKKNTSYSASQFIMVIRCKNYFALTPAKLSGKKQTFWLFPV